MAHAIDDWIHNTRAGNCEYRDDVVTEGEQCRVCRTKGLIMDHLPEQPQA